MFKNKMVNIVLIILVALTLGGIIALVLINNFTKEPDLNVEPTIDEIIAHSYETEEITTNLLSNDFIKASFKIHANDKASFQELQKRDFQINNIIIRTLSGIKSADLAGPEGIETLEATIRDQLNEIMQDGKVVKVYTTRWVIQ